MTMQTLHDSGKYKSFIQDRNREIQKIEWNTQTDVSRLLFESLDRITGFVSHMGIQGKLTIANMSYLSRQLDSYLWQEFHRLLPLLLGRMKRMRQATFTLTYFSELEAIARATKKTRHSDRHRFKTAIHRQMNQKTITGQDLDARIWVVLMKLQSEILQRFTSAMASELNPKEIVDEIKKVYPKIKAYKKPPRSLKPIQESDRSSDDDKKEFEFYHDLTNDEDWELAVQAYKDTELPASRFDQEKMYDPEVGYMRYDWEIEQDLTDDFVKQVRDGQVEAADDLGIQEFVWVAIIDNKTCENCCLPRNGKTTSEIEKMADDDCDAAVPPAHSNCRCDVSPIANVDEVEGPDWKSFDEWLAA